MNEASVLSQELKRRVSDAKVTLFGSVGMELVSDAVGRMGFKDVNTYDKGSAFPECDVAICHCIHKDQCADAIRYYMSDGIPVICLFNFGIGVCATVITPDSPLPNFMEDKSDCDMVTAMLDYASGYSAFWHIERNRWLEYADKWIATQEISSSVGEYAMASVATHLLIAIVAGNEVKTYPKFYLSTIANDIY